MSSENAARNRRSRQRNSCNAYIANPYQLPQDKLREFQTQQRQQQLVQQQQPPPQQQTPQQQPPQQQQQTPQQQPPQQQTPHQQQTPQQQQNALDKVDPEPEEPVSDAAFNLLEEIPAAGSMEFGLNADQMHELGLCDQNDKIMLKKIVPTRKKASLRVKEKRMRENRRLRKSIIPKNALMALREVKGISVGDFVVTYDPSGGFIATLTVNGKEYEGRGPSKTAAKNKVSEEAMRDYIIAKMHERPRKKHDITKGSAGNENENSMDTYDKTQEVPMSSLLSFAIYKLFKGWEDEGYVVPEMHSPSADQLASGDENTRIELPETWKDMHPGTLLSIMRPPGVIYVDKGFTAESPDSILYNVGLTVDGQDFEASGRSKKIARRKIAAMACNFLFNTNFDLETSQVPA